MKINTGFLMTPAGQALILAGVVGAAMYYGQKKAVEMGQAVNPNSKDNVVYSGVNAVGKTLTGKDNFDLGVWIYDTIHGEVTP